MPDKNDLTLSGALQEQIDDHLERRATRDRELIKDTVDAALTDAVSELRNDLAQRVERQFTRDRDFIKETIGAALKVLGIAVGFVTVIITLFGIKTLGDIREAVTTTARNSFEQRLKDPTSTEFKSLERILDRTVLDSYTLQLFRQRAQKDRFRRDVSVVLSDNDRLRLIKLLRSPESDRSQFGDTATVLVEASGDNQWARVLPVLVDAVMAKGPDFEWLKAEPEKRAFIVQLLGKKRGEPFAGLHDLLTDKTIGKELRIACIRYSGQVRAVNYVTEFEGLSRDGDVDVAQAAIETLARLAPTNRRVEEWIESRIQGKGPIDRVSARNLLMVGKSLVDGRPEVSGFHRRDPDEEFRIALAKRIWRSLATKSEQMIWKESGGFSERDRQLQVLLTSRNSPGSGFILPAGVIFGSRMEAAVNQLLEESVREPGPSLLGFRQLLETLGALDDNASIVGVSAKLGKATTMALENGIVLSQANAPAGVGIKLIAGEAPKVLVRWTDATGGERVGTLQGFPEATGLEFQVRTNDRTKSIAEDE